jgi:hypothetical protein
VSIRKLIILLFPTPKFGGPVQPPVEIDFGIKTHYVFGTVNKENPWLSERRKEQIRMLHLISALAIRNNFVTSYKKTAFIVRMLAALYYPIARIRMLRSFLDFPLELKGAE